MILYMQSLECMWLQEREMERVFITYRHANCHTYVLAKLYIVNVHCHFQHWTVVCILPVSYRERTGWSI